MRSKHKATHIPANDTPISSEEEAGNFSGGAALSSKDGRWKNFAPCSNFHSWALGAYDPDGGHGQNICCARTEFHYHHRSSQGSLPCRSCRTIQNLGSRDQDPDREVPSCGSGIAGGVRELRLSHFHGDRAGRIDGQVLRRPRNAPRLSVQSPWSVPAQSPCGGHVLPSGHQCCLRVRDSQDRLLQHVLLLHVRIYPPPTP